MKYAHSIAVLLIFSLQIPFLSCNRLMTSAYGIKNPAPIDNSQLISVCRDMRIDQYDNYTLDSMFFADIEDKDTATASDYVSDYINKYLQPLQVFYFERSGRLISHHANCYAGGFPLLKWDRDNRFDVFPAKSATDISDGLVDLALLNRYIVPVLKASGEDSSPDYTVVVFWDKFMLKQSRHLVSIVRKNIAPAEQQGIKVKLVFVNNDNVFASEDVSL